VASSEERKERFLVLLEKELTALSAKSAVPGYRKRVEAALKLLISKEKLRLELESGSGPILSDIRSEIDSISTFLQEKGE